MRAFSYEKEFTGVDSIDIDVSGVVNATYSLSFSGTATAKIEFWAAPGTYYNVIGSTSTADYAERDYCLGRVRASCTAHTSGSVYVSIKGMRAQ